MEFQRPKKDTLGRRKPHCGRQPTGKNVRITQDDITGTFEPLQRHGILPSHYLFEFRKALTPRNSKNEFQHRLKHLYHEGPILNRPEPQWASPEADYQHVSYVLDTLAYEALNAAGKRFEYASQADKGWYDHQHLTGCITGSIELAAMKAGAVYGDQEEIFTHHLCPDSTRKKARPIELNLGTRTEFDRHTGLPKDVQTTIIPDQLFRITYPKPTIRFFALEVDCATEDYDTVYEKLRRWVYVLDNDIHRKQWGTPSLIVLIATTNPLRRKKLEAKLKTFTKDLDPFLFIDLPMFNNATWRVPPVMYDLFGKWHRADGSTFDISY